MNEKPTYTTLLTYFEKVPDWKTVAAHLLNDDDGSKTEEIDRSNQYKVEDCRQEMLRRYLRSGDVSWKNVLDALTKANYINLVKEIKEAEKL